MKLETTLKATIWATKNVKTQIREKGLDRYASGGKMKFEGSSRSNKKSKILKADPIDKKFGGKKEAKWREKCKNKYFERCNEEVTC